MCTPAQSPYDITGVSVWRADADSGSEPVSDSTVEGDVAPTGGKNIPELGNGTASAAFSSVRGETDVRKRIAPQISPRKACCPWFHGNTGEAHTLPRSAVGMKISFLECYIIRPAPTALRGSNICHRCGEYIHALTNNTRTLTTLFRLRVTILRPEQRRRFGGPSIPAKCCWPVLLGPGRVP